MALQPDKSMREQAKREGKAIIQISIDRKYVPHDRRPAGGEHGAVDKFQFTGPTGEVCDKELTDLLVSWIKRDLI